MDVEIDSNELQIELEIDSSVKVSGTDDYNDLINLPTLNGETIKGDMTEIDPTVPEWSKQSTKPTYTADEVNALDVDAALTLEEIDELFNNAMTMEG
jgi:hypothetical protein